MTTENEEIIKDLKQKISTIEKQKQILFEFTQLVPDFVSAAISCLPDPKRTESKLLDLQRAAFDAMGKMAKALI